jgi:allantoin racemase
VLRIRYVNPTGSGELDHHFEEALRGAAGEDVEISVAHLELGDRSSGPFLPRLPFYQGVLFETLYAAQTDGFDAAVIGCSGDPGLLEARRMLDIPVTAPLESALLLASQLGQRVAILVADGFEAHVLYEDLARIYGMRHVISEILTVPMGYPGTEGHEHAVIDRHRAVLAGPALELAQGALACGANTIYAGCTLWTGEMLAPFREALGAPVIDPAQAAVLTAVAAARAGAGVRRPAGAVA